LRRRPLPHRHRPPFPAQARDYRPLPALPRRSLPWGDPFRVCGGLYRLRRCFAMTEAGTGEPPPSFPSQCYGNRIMATLDFLTDDPARPALKAPHLPSSSAEKATLVIHYYRGELGRMASWRDRIDRTSNWAITVVAG